MVVGERGSPGLTPEEQAARSRRLDLEPGDSGAQGTNPDPNLLQGTHFRRGTRIPDSVVAGTEFTVSGVQHYDNPLALQVPDQRTRLDASFATEPFLQNHGPIPHCSTRGFSFTLMAPSEVGETISIELRAQQLALEGWQTRDSLGPFDINVVTEAQKQREILREWGTWAGVGATAGALAAPVYEQPRATGAAVGGGLGLGSKIVWDQASAAFPQIGTVEVIAGTALLGAAGFFLSQVRGIDVPGVPGA